MGCFQGDDGNGGPVNMAPGRAAQWPGGRVGLISDEDKPKTEKKKKNNRAIPLPPRLELCIGGWTLWD